MTFIRNLSIGRTVMRKLMRTMIVTTMIVTTMIVGTSTTTPSLTARCQDSCNQ